MEGPIQHYLPTYHHYLPTYLPSLPIYLPTIHTYLPVYHFYLPELSHAPSYMFYHHIIAYHEWTTRTGELLAAAADDATVIHLLWL
jgi:hypothetical protein